MKTLSDTDDLPDCRLSVRATVSVIPSAPILRITRDIHDQLARRIANSVLDNPKCFWSNFTDENGLTMLNYGADVIILTTEEFIEVKKKAYLQGWEGRRELVASAKAGYQDTIE